MLTPDEMARNLAWEGRQLKFGAATLAEIVAEFNRYNREKLEIGDPILAGRRFGGTFRADEPRTLVALLQAHFGILVERRGNVTVLRLRRPS